ncbi:hypothetical protein [Halorubellus sp. PRR65]|uniref:hypothetical protein n=1 Tax=Halorubellus sp. PRR65 TaxID=3098148 RepID=UPI002B2598B8|nr:hypothetical protein [Halorubellus sp. PRR65]
MRHWASARERARYAHLGDAPFVVLTTAGYYYNITFVRVVPAWTAGRVVPRPERNHDTQHDLE